ncbi:hypothetical protein IFM89_026919 [Coptis chinensis]|uniref:C2 domain-containing protein n=1 Tax=Coptis chinensis TaxID=261450 RepID=A0A835I062_9MAGN|nr:hypothetical protein IFM89_026919 [Coptis chinensis]
MEKEKLVVEVVGAHNLMPKDGEGSSSAFVEVEFENQTLRTQVKYKDLNPVWNEKLVFHVSDVADLPYRTVEVSVHNERKSGNSSRNFLGKVRISGSNIAKEGEEMAQMFTLDKRSLFSHVRGEVSLKLYITTKEEVTKEHKQNQKKQKKMFQQQQKQQMSMNSTSSTMFPLNQQQKQHMVQKNQQQQQNQILQQLGKPMEPNQGEMKPVVITTGPGSGIGPSPNQVHAPVNAGSAHGGGGNGFHGFNEFSLKETSPHLGGGAFNKDKTSSTYDLVEQVQYLYVRVVKARDISTMGEVTAEVKLGNYRGITKKSGSSSPEWDQVFAFSKDCIQSSVVEIFVKENNKDDFLGRVWYDLSEVPKRVPPDSQLAPQWYRMEDRRGDKSKGGEVMASIWFGTQADEAFAEAWHSKAANVHLDSLCSIKSKVYLSPKLWCLRVSIIEAQDLVPGEKGSGLMRFPEIMAKAQVGNQVLRTRVAPATANRGLSNPFWNEDMMFVVSEPFEDYLMVSVEDRLAPGRDEVLGRIHVPVNAIERRLDNKPVVSKWFSLDMNNNFNESKVSNRFGSRIHLRSLSLDGGYHVLDESMMYSSDGRPTAKQLWKPHVGVF